MAEKFELIEFDDEAIPLILELYNKELDDSGNVIDKNIGEPEMDVYSNINITKDNFGGILVGSKVFISKNVASIAEHISKFCNNGRC